MSIKIGLMYLSVFICLSHCEEIRIAGTDFCVAYHGRKEGAYGKHSCDQ